MMIKNRLYPARLIVGAALMATAAGVLPLASEVSASPKDSVSGEHRMQDGPAKTGPDGSRLQKWREERGNSEKRHERMAKELGLTEEQKAQLKALRGNPSNRKADHQKIKAAHQEIRQLMESDTATDDQIRAKAKDLDELMRARQSEHIEKMLAMRKILTPAQREIMRKKMHDRMQDMKNNHEGRGHDSRDGGPGGHDDEHGDDEQE